MLRVGTRGSKLALAQSGQVADSLRAHDPSLVVELVVIATPDSTAGDKSRYVAGIEQQLRSEEIDLAVHSAKDIPGEESPDLKLVAVPPRAAAFDVLIGAPSLGALAQGATVGTSSVRRSAQLKTARPDLRVEPLRGNIDTRLARLADGSYDAIVLAAAGLERLGAGGDLQRVALDDFVPAPGQGCLGLQVREVDLTTTTIVAGISDTNSQHELLAERAAAIALSASCNTPIGVRAVVSGGSIRVSGWLGLPDGSAWVADTVEGMAADAQSLGVRLAERMRAAGGGELLQRAEEMAI